MGKFVRLGCLNAETLYNKGMLGKGTLVKYRINAHSQLMYTPKSKEYYWQYGIVSEILWYAPTPRPMTKLLTGEDMYPKVYDLTVFNSQTSKRDYLDFNNFEVLILVSE